MRAATPRRAAFSLEWIAQANWLGAYMNIQAATQDYETWLGKRITLVPEELAVKHKALAAGLFPFFRATFYRWMQICPRVCAECAKPPTVLGGG